MKSRLLIVLLGLAAVGATPTYATAIIDDPLHGFCNGSGPSANTCQDVQGHTILGNSTDFGFTISPAPQIGDFQLVILIPDNYTAPTSIAITGTQGGTDNTQAITGSATEFSATPWTSGFLADYLGGSFQTASPTNGIGAYLPATLSLDTTLPAPDGYFVFVADLGQTQFLDNSNTTGSPTLDAATLAQITPFTGAYINAFCIDCTTEGNNPKTNTVATANSGALLVDNGGVVPPQEIPEPGMLALLSVGLFGLGATAMRRRS